MRRRRTAEPPPGRRPLIDTRRIIYDTFKSPSDALRILTLYGLTRQINRLNTSLLLSLDFS